MVPAGSDAPVEQGDPRIEFYAAVARRSLDGQQLEGWHPELAMTRAEALKAHLVANGVGAATLAKVGGTVVAEGDEKVTVAVTAPCK